ncbi:MULTISPECIES: phosphotransferase [unclassified Micromonospora]|uniref:phosphotransferase n=1 Tax=unclassified Micromonospora TaxID=2617518 RepID=UPI0033296687
MADGGLLASGRDADVYALGDLLVLRRYRRGGDVTAEATVMAYLEKAGFPVPRVHEANGPDLVMERVDGPTMLQALLDARLTPVAAARLLADVHRRLHAVPPRRGTDPAARILHMDLHPDNVILSGRGPVVIDWRNATEGPADLDVAMTAVLLGQVAVDATHALAAPAAAVLTAFLTTVGGGPLSVLDRAVAMRRADPASPAGEVDHLAGVAAHIVATCLRRG